MIRGPTRTIEGTARALERPPASVGTLVPLLILVGMLGVALFVPPILLLNLPILFARAALAMWRADAYQGVWLDAFACPECAADVPEAAEKAELPFPAGCVACGAALTVERPARRNLVGRAGDPEG